MAYSAAYVFGDSLVDSGNVLKLAEWYDGIPFIEELDGAPTAEAGYFMGRFSNGYTFADLVANKAVGSVTKPVFPYHFEDPWLGIPIAPFASDPSGISLNFAYGGSHIQGGETPDLDKQTDAFRDAVDGDAPPGALYLVTTGGNDIRDLAPTGSDPVSQAEAYEELQDCADELFEELAQLIDHGAHNIVITGIPDVGLIPHYDRDGDGVLNATEQMRSDAATDYSIYLDTLIRTEVVPALQALGANVIYVPVMDYVDASGNLVTGALNANIPTIAALHGLTTEELSNNLLQYKDLLFFDHVHPNAQAHALLGAYMHAMISGTPWIETLPLTSAEVDYHTTATISVAGEVDQLVIAMVAGTTYTFDMLGVSSLGTTGSLADPALRLLGSAGTMVASDDDSGAGFDATVTYGAVSNGNYTLQLYSVGSPTGNYVLQAAVVGGTAMLAGNNYVVNSASTLVIEGAGGIGEDVVRTSVNYTLTPGSEIETLRTTSDGGRTAINLTGNEFGQTLIGNAGVNVLDGKGGADILFGKIGKDVFVLGQDAIANPLTGIDAIADYTRGEIVDITQVLSVASGTDVTTGGYLRVTTDGLIQVDLNGGGNEWATLSTINGIGPVTFRYLAGGSATTVSLSRVPNSSSTTLLAGAVAAAGMAVSEPSVQSAIEVWDTPSGAAAKSGGDAAAGGSWRNGIEAPWQIEGARPADAVANDQSASTSNMSAPQLGPLASFDSAPTPAATDLPLSIEALAEFAADATHLIVARSVSMPSAAQIKLIAEAATEIADNLGELAQKVADAVEGGAIEAPTVDAILAALVPTNELAVIRGEPVDEGQLALADVPQAPLAIELMGGHPDAVSS